MQLIHIKPNRNLTKYCMLDPEGTLSKSLVCNWEPCCTFTVGVIVSQGVEAILTNTAVSCLQVHAVGVLHAAVAFRAEVMTCRRHREEKVDSQRREEASSGKVTASCQPFLTTLSLWTRSKIKMSKIPFVSHLTFINLF